MENYLENNIIRSKENVKKVYFVAGSLFAYALFFERLGYIFATLLFLIFLFRISSASKWWFILSASVITVSATYILFTVLGVRFPYGILKGILGD